MKSTRFLLVLMLLVTAVTVACGDHDMEGTGHEGHGDGHEGHGEMGSDTAERIPNEGQVVRIVSPVTGDTFAEGDEVEIVVEFENFDISDEGNHWHYYVDGGGQTMITDGFDSRIRDLAAGEHTIEVYIAGSSHKEFEDGDMVMITVE